MNIHDKDFNLKQKFETQNVV